MEHDENSNISDEILKQAKEYIGELLKNKRLRAETKAQLEIQSYFLMFLTSDHEKIAIMYPFVKREMARREKLDKLLDKFQWALIPMIITAIFGFAGQFIYVWAVALPELLKMLGK